MHIPNVQVQDAEYGSSSITSSITSVLTANAFICSCGRGLVHIISSIQQTNTSTGERKPAQQVSEGDLV